MFIAWLRRQGLQPSDTAVCYDGGNGAMAVKAVQKNRDRLLLNARAPVRFRGE